MNSLNSTLHIDRTTPFVLANNPLFNFLSAQYSVGKENPRSVTLADVDVSRIELKTIFDEMENLKDLKPAQYNEYIKKNLDQLEQDGYFLLDAKVLQALLEQPHYIPSDWEIITDADSVPREASGSIGFYGTHLQPLGTGDPEILTPFFNRGHWESHGHNSLYFSQEDIASFEKQPVLNIRKYAAVYK